MAYISDWKLTITSPGTARVVVDHGGKLADELKLGWAQTTQAAPALRATNLRQLARGNAAREMVLTVFDDHATAAAARDWMLALNVATAAAYANKTLALRLEVASGATYDIAEAVLRDVYSQLSPVTPLRTVTTWSFLHGGMVIVP